MKTRSSEEGQKLQGIADKLWAMAHQKEEEIRFHSHKTVRQVLEAQGFSYAKAAELLEAEATEADNSALNNQE